MHISPYHYDYLHPQMKTLQFELDLFFSYSINVSCYGYIRQELTSLKYSSDHPNYAMNDFQVYNSSLTCVDKQTFII